MLDLRVDWVITQELHELLDLDALEVRSPFSTADQLTKAISDLLFTYPPEYIGWSELERHQWRFKAVYKLLDAVEGVKLRTVFMGNSCSLRVYYKGTTVTIDRF